MILPLNRFLELCEEYLEQFPNNRSTLDRYIIGAFRDLGRSGVLWGYMGNWGDTQLTLAEQLKNALSMAFDVSFRQPQGSATPSFVLFRNLLSAMSDDEILAMAEGILRYREEFFEWHESWRVHTTTLLFWKALKEERLWVELER